MPDRASRVMPPEPDPAKLVHGAAMRGIKRKGSFLVLMGRRQVAAGQAHLAGEEVDIRLVRGQAARPGRRLSGDVESLGRQGGLGDADVRLPVARREPPRFIGGPQRMRVVAQVNQGVAGQAVRPLVRGVKGHRPAGGGAGVGVAVRAQVRAGHQAPGPGALRLGRHHPGEQLGGLPEALDVEHRRSARQLLPQLDHRRQLKSVGACAGRPPGRRRSRLRWRTGPRCGRYRTRRQATA